MEYHCLQGSFVNHEGPNTKGVLCIKKLGTHELVTNTLNFYCVVSVCSSLC